MGAGSAEVQSQPHSTSTKEKMACVIPTNKSICEALEKKAASYPAEKFFQRKNYQEASRTLASLCHNLYSVNLDDPIMICDKIESYFGPKTTEFIIDFIKSNPLVKQEMEVKSENKCMHPANKDIYDSLVWKANNYPADEIYRKNAYMKAAQKVADLDVNLWACTPLEFLKILDTFGPSTAKYIEEFITDNYEHDYLEIAKEEYTDSLPQKILHKENIGLYNALLKKANSYMPDQKYQKEAYQKAANMVATADFSYYTEEGEDDISMYWGPKTGDFALEYLDSNPLKA
jgi:hypothetical protein